MSFLLKDRRSRLLDVFACFVLIILILAFLNKGVRMQGVFFGADEGASDLLHFSYPYHEFWATDYLKKGNIALWNPYLASGVPILAEAQTGMFYPAAVLLYYFLPPPVAFNWLIISSFLILAAGTYVYARTIGVTPFVAFFSSSVFILSGFMWGHLRHVPVITAVAPMPFMFLAVEKIVRGGKSMWMIVLAGAIAMSLLAGHYTTTYLIIFILIIYFLIRMKGNEHMGIFFYFFGAVVLGGLISAVQLLPSLELMQYSTRLNTDLLRAMSPNYAWKYLGLFFYPYLFGDPSRATWDMEKANFWENIGYFGIIPLIFCIGALFFRIGKDKTNAAAVKIVFVISFFLMLGFLTPVYKILSDFIPGFSLTRISSRFLLFIDFFGAILAGFVLEKLKKVWAGAIVFFTITELFYLGYSFNTVMPTSYFSEPPSVRFIKARDSGLYRMSSVAFSSWPEAWKKAGGWRGSLQPYIDQREVIPPDLNLFYRMPSPSIIYELAGHFSVKRPGELDSYAFQLFMNGMGKDFLANIWGMMNVKYIINNVPIDDVAGLTLIKKTDHAYIYENEHNLPRAYVVGNARKFANGSDVFKTILKGDIDPKREVLLEGVDAVPTATGSGQVTIDSYNDTNVRLGAMMQKEGYLILSDTYYPGWHAYIDGKETKIYQANYAFRAVRVEKGNHTIVFSYDPLSYKIGKYVSVISVVVLIILTVYPPVRRRFLKFH